MSVFDLAGDGALRQWVLFCGARRLLNKVKSSSAWEPSSFSSTSSPPPLSAILHSLILPFPYGTQVPPRHIPFPGLGASTTPLLKAGRRQNDGTPKTMLPPTQKRNRNETSIETGRNPSVAERVQDRSRAPCCGRIRGSGRGRIRGRHAIAGRRKGRRRKHLATHPGFHQGGGFERKGRRQRGHRPSPR